ncbi:MAG: hypothetical protein M3Z02_00565 [Actinomycetota bacterium]|nr:hypothetical protein [Actinomycetota bacterium]
MTALIVLEALAIALLGLLVAGLLRSHAEILRQLHLLGAGRDDGVAAAGPVDVEFGVRPGVAAPGRPETAARDLVGRTPDDEIVMLAVSGTASDTLLAFLSSGCLTCQDFWSAFASPRLDVPVGSRLIVVTKGPEHESESAVAALAPPGVTVVMSSQAWDDYGVPGSPYFIQVDGTTGAVVGEGSATSWDQVRTLLDQAGGDAEARDKRARRFGRSDTYREARADQELLAAGIGPGHASLSAPPAPPAGDH